MNSDSSEQNPGFDSRFILMIVLIGAVWMGWQSYLAKRYPNHPTPIAATSNTEAAPTSVASAMPNMAAPQVLPQATEMTIKYSDPTWSFVVSSRGMAIQDVKLNKYTSRKNQSITFAQGDGLGLFSTRVLGQAQPLDFKISQTGNDTFVGKAQVGAMTITKQIHIDSAKYTFTSEVDVTNPYAGFKGLVTEVADKIPPAVSGFLRGRFEHQEFFAEHDDGKTSRTIVSPSKTVNDSYTKGAVAGYGSQYFAIGILDHSPVMPNIQQWSEPGAEPKAVEQLKYDMFNPAADFKISYTGFAGPKSYDLLKSISPEMTGLINFGFFTTIAKGIFWLMKMIHSVIPNWGLAIIVLTLIVRAIVAPFNILSYRQMRAMARIQPQIKALRERYKDDTQKLNQEMLQLMRENKANPIGGCLPMFLQIPIFFALYEVIGQSIELYKAPFGFWIHDLSAKDPYYIIPILMGVAMWAQQKITPNTMDPSQQKIMQFMPLVFTVMTVQLPSGLTLYIFVSSLFGFLQQYLFTKENKQLSVVRA